MPQIQRRSRSTPFFLAASVLAGLLALEGCSAGSGDDPFGFVVRRSRVSTASSTPVFISGRYFAFLADEATTAAGGTDMNVDGDKIDSIAILVNVNTGIETHLDVAATAVALIEDELYMVVDEALDGRNWEPVDTGDKIVLLHVDGTTPTQVPDFIDAVDPAPATKMIAYRTNLFFSRARQTPDPLESNLAVIAAADPLVANDVPTTDADGPLSPRILGKDEGLLFFGLDETVQGRDLNGDADATDTNVLALMDGTVATGTIHSTGLAMPAGEPVIRARRTSTSSHDWQVGFLVSEAAQGATNLNNPALFSGTWKPSQCVGDEDADTNDAVLHVLDFSAWIADPVLAPPVNTGLVGSQRICIANGFVATLSLESDEGTCDLNADGDTTDRVVRWTQIVATGTPIVPLNAPENLRAVVDCPGGTRGLAELDERFVALVGELEDDQDIDGGGLTHQLLGWLSPSTTPHAWDFTHGSNNTTFVGATTMAEIPDRTRLCVAFPENISGTNINRHTNPVIAGEDTDTNDSVPTFADFGSANTMLFPGVAIAVDKDNAGIVISKSYGFYRVSEAEDSRDWNNDLDETDFILFRTSLSQSVSTATAVLNNLTLGGNATSSIIVDTFAPGLRPPRRRREHRRQRRER